VNLICCFRKERGKAGPVVAAHRVVGGSVPSGENREELSTETGAVGGPARSSEEAAVMVVERRCRAIQSAYVGQPDSLGGA
jgi:hypothetical protein